MPWEPGKSGNPNGYKGPRDRVRRQVFDTIKNLGHRDALETLSYLHNNEQKRIRAAPCRWFVPADTQKQKKAPGRGSQGFQ